MNDLKAENAQLRMKLLLPSSTPDRSMRGGEDSTGSCRTCMVLETQVQRLTAEIDEIRYQASTRDKNSQYENRELLEALSKESRRRSRMESIIHRQQDYIRELSHRIKETQGDLYHTSEEYHGSESGANYSPDPMREIRVPDRPWEVDMDDLFRQLDDLDEKVHDVEEQTNRLTNSTRAAFAPARADHVFPQHVSSIGSSRSSGNGVLGRIMHGTA